MHFKKYVVKYQYDLPYVATTNEMQKKKVVVEIIMLAVKKKGIFNQMNKLNIITRKQYLKNLILEKTFEDKNSN